MACIVACPDPELLAALCAFTARLQSLPDLRGSAPPCACSWPRWCSDSYHRLDPETAMQAALWLLDGTSLLGLKELILTLDGK